LREERAHFEASVNTSNYIVSFFHPSASQGVLSLVLAAKSSLPFSFHEILAFSESKRWLMLSACHVPGLILLSSTLQNIFDFQYIYTKSHLTA
jgi:hypothetical protein